MVVDVKKIVEDKKYELKDKILRLKSKNIIPKLVLICASDDKASKIYIDKKRNMCKELDIEEEELLFDESITTNEIVTSIKKLNKDNLVHGILVQLPLYKHLNEKEILSSISPDKDVDGLHPLNLGKLFAGEKSIVSCTPKGIMSVLKALNIPIEGKNAVIVGRSILVGKPISALLLNENATVTMCHSKTCNLKSYTLNADILIAAVGKSKIITEDMVKEGSIVIDVGINRLENKKIVGDVDTQNVNKVVKYVTPVPGGIGLTTVLSLLENVIDVAENYK